MKLIALKLTSLLVLAASMLSLGYFFKWHSIFDQSVVYLKDFFVLDDPQGILITTGGWITISLLLMLSFYALIPVVRRKKRTIEFTGQDGQVTIELDAAEKSLVNVLKKLPQVKKVNVYLTPTKNGQKAQVMTKAVLRNTPGEEARETFNLINHYIVETAKHTLGLEIITPPHLDVLGVVVNPDETSQVLRASSSTPKEDQHTADPEPDLPEPPETIEDDDNTPVPMVMDRFEEEDTDDNAPLVLNEDTPSGLSLTVPLEEEPVSSDDEEEEKSGGSLV